MQHYNWNVKTTFIEPVNVIIVSPFEYRNILLNANVHCAYKMSSPIISHQFIIDVNEFQIEMKCDAYDLTAIAFSVPSLHPNVIIKRGQVMFQYSFQKYFHSSRNGHKTVMIFNGKRKQK